MRKENRIWLSDKEMRVLHKKLMQIVTANNIGEEGARMISYSLKCNNTLTSLYLSCDEKEKQLNIKRQRYEHTEIKKYKSSPLNWLEYE